MTQPNSMGDPLQPRLTPPQLAKMWGVKADKVRAWIKNGELSAINVATTPYGRPVYRITYEAIAAFEKKRTDQDPRPAPRKYEGRRQSRAPKDFLA